MQSTALDRREQLTSACTRRMRSLGSQCGETCELTHHRGGRPEHCRHTCREDVAQVHGALHPPAPREREACLRVVPSARPPSVASRVAGNRSRLDDHRAKRPTRPAAIRPLTSGSGIAKEYIVAEAASFGQFFGTLPTAEVSRKGDYDMPFLRRQLGPADIERMAVKRDMVGLIRALDDTRHGSFTRTDAACA